MRKMISFKVENLPPKQQEIINKWADGQTNIQQSLANIVMHVVEFTGNADVMDFEVQRKLHTILSDKATVIDTIKKEDKALTTSEQTNKINIKQNESVVTEKNIYKDASSIFED